MKHHRRFIKCSWAEGWVQKPSPGFDDYSSTFTSYLGGRLSVPLLALRDLSFVPAAFSALILPHSSVSSLIPVHLHLLGCNRCVCQPKKGPVSRRYAEQSLSPAHGCHSLLAGHILLVVVHALSQLQETVRKVFVDVFTPHVGICGGSWHR